MSKAVDHGCAQAIRLLTLDNFLVDVLPQLDEFTIDREGGLDLSGPNAGFEALEKSGVAGWQD